MTQPPQIQLFRSATFILLGIGFLHPIVHFLTRKPMNETERILFQLMHSYHKPIVGGELTMMDIQDGLNICYGMFFVALGIVNLYCLRHQQTNRSFIKGLGRIESVFFLLGAGISIIYFYWLPVVYFLILSACFAWSGAHLLKKMEYSFRNPKPLS